MTMTAAMTVDATGMSVSAIRAKLAKVRSVRGYSFREASAWTDALRRALANAPELPPAPMPRSTCCERASVSYECTCSYVTRCDEHGERHHGTHD